MNRTFFASSKSNQFNLLFFLLIIVPTLSPVIVSVNILPFNIWIISSVPLPWWTSKSTIAILLISFLYLYLAYAAPIATLFTIQNPIEAKTGFSTGPKYPAWWPGGLTRANAFLTVPFITRSIASKTQPVVLYMFSYEYSFINVSQSIFW